MKIEPLALAYQDLDNDVLRKHYVETYLRYEESLKEIPGESDLAYNDRVEQAEAELDTVHRHMWYRPELHSYAAYTAPHLRLVVVFRNGEKEIMQVLDAGTIKVNDGYANKAMIGACHWSETVVSTWDAKIIRTEQCAIERAPDYVCSSQS